VKQPSILDVLHGVKAVAPAHPEVKAWWYTPPQRLRLAGELPGLESALTLEVVVEHGAGAGEETIATGACDAIAKELSLALGGAVVGVRTHRGDREERPLFRVVSRAGGHLSSEAPHAT
jgi:hypothetical protein